MTVASPSSPSPPLSVRIRTERAGDAAAISALTSAAFAAAPHASGTEAAIVEGLRRAGALELSLVAEMAGEPVGHVAFSAVAIPGAAGRWYGLGPVSVDPAHQRRGVGARLVEDGLARLRARGAAGCVVLGDPAWYGRFGFANDPELRYGDVPPPWLQRIVFAGAAPTGAVRYHAAFGG